MKILNNKFIKFISHLLIITLFTTFVSNDYIYAATANSKLPNLNELRKQNGFDKSFLRISNKEQSAINKSAENYLKKISEIYNSQKSKMEENFKTQSTEMENKKNEEINGIHKNSIEQKDKVDKDYLKNREEYLENANFKKEQILRDFADKESELRKQLNSEKQKLANVLANNSAEQQKRQDARDKGKTINTVLGPVKNLLGGAINPVNKLTSLPDAPDASGLINNMQGVVADLQSRLDNVLDAKDKTLNDLENKKKDTLDSMETFKNEQTNSIDEKTNSYISNIENNHTQKINDLKNFNDKAIENVYDMSKSEVENYLFDEKNGLYTKAYEYDNDSIMRDLKINSQPKKPNITDKESGFLGDIEKWISAENQKQVALSLQFLDKAKKMINSGASEVFDKASELTAASSTSTKDVDILLSPNVQGIGSLNSKTPLDMNEQENVQEVGEQITTDKKIKEFENKTENVADETIKETKNRANSYKSELNEYSDDAKDDINKSTQKYLQETEQAEKEALQDLLQFALGLEEYLDMVWPPEASSGDFDREVREKAYELYKNTKRDFWQALVAAIPIFVGCIIGFIAGVVLINAAPASGFFAALVILTGYAIIGASLYILADTVATLMFLNNDYDRMTEATEEAYQKYQDYLKQITNPKYFLPGQEDSEYNVFLKAQKRWEAAQNAIKPLFYRVFGLFHPSQIKKRLADIKKLLGGRSISSLNADELQSLQEMLGFFKKAHESTFFKQALLNLKNEYKAYQVEYDKLVNSKRILEDGRTVGEVYKDVTFWGSVVSLLSNMLENNLAFDGSANEFRDFSDDAGTKWAKNRDERHKFMSNTLGDWGTMKNPILQMARIMDTVTRQFLDNTPLGLFMSDVVGVSLSSVNFEKNIGNGLSAMGLNHEWDFIASSQYFVIGDILGEFGKTVGIGDMLNFNNYIQLGLDQITIGSVNFGDVYSGWGDFRNRQKEGFFVSIANYMHPTKMIREGAKEWGKDGFIGYAKWMAKSIALMGLGLVENFSGLRQGLIWKEISGEETNPDTADRAVTDEKTGEVYYEEGDTRIWSTDFMKQGEAGGTIFMMWATSGGLTNFIKNLIKNSGKTAGATVGATAGATAGANAGATAGANVGAMAAIKNIFKATKGNIVVRIAKTIGISVVKALEKLGHFIKEQWNNFRAKKDLAGNILKDGAGKTIYKTNLVVIKDLISGFFGAIGVRPIYRVFKQAGSDLASGKILKGVQGVFGGIMQTTIYVGKIALTVSTYGSSGLLAAVGVFAAVHAGGKAIEFLMKGNNKAAQEVQAQKQAKDFLKKVFGDKIKGKTLEIANPEQAHAVMDFLKAYGKAGLIERLLTGTGEVEIKTGWKRSSKVVIKSGGESIQKAFVESTSSTGLKQLQSSLETRLKTATTDEAKKINSMLEKINLEIIKREVISKVMLNTNMTFEEFQKNIGEDTAQKLSPEDIKRLFLESIEYKRLVEMQKVSTYRDSVKSIVEQELKNAREKTAKEMELKKDNIEARIKESLKKAVDAEMKRTNASESSRVDIEAKLKSDIETEVKTLVEGEVKTKTGQTALEKIAEAIETGDRVLLKLLAETGKIKIAEGIETEIKGVENQDIKKILESDFFKEVTGELFNKTLAMLNEQVSLPYHQARLEILKRRLEGANAEERKQIESDIKKSEKIYENLRHMDLVKQGKEVFFEGESETLQSKGAQSYKQELIAKLDVELTKKGLTEQEKSKIVNQKGVLENAGAAKLAEIAETGVIKAKMGRIERFLRRSVRRFSRNAQFDIQKARFFQETQKLEEYLSTDNLTKIESGTLIETDIVKGMNSRIADLMFVAKNIQIKIILREPKVADAEIREKYRQVEAELKWMEEALAEKKVGDKTTELDKKKAALEEKLKDAEIRSESLRSQITTLESEIQSLKSQKSATQKEIQQKEIEVSKLDAELRKLNEGIDLARNFDGIIIEKGGGEIQRVLQFEISDAVVNKNYLKADILMTLQTSIQNSGFLERMQGRQAGQVTRQMRSLMKTVNSKFMAELSLGETRYGKEYYKAKMFNNDLSVQGLAKYSSGVLNIDISKQLEKVETKAKKEQIKAERKIEKLTLGETSLSKKYKSDTMKSSREVVEALDFGKITQEAQEARTAEKSETQTMLKAVEAKLKEIKVKPVRKWWNRETKNDVGQKRALERMRDQLHQFKEGKIEAANLEQNLQRAVSDYLRYSGRAGVEFLKSKGIQLKQGASQVEFDAKVRELESSKSRYETYKKFGKIERLEPVKPTTDYTNQELRARAQESLEKLGISADEIKKIQEKIDVGDGSKKVSVGDEFSEVLKSKQHEIDVELKTRIDAEVKTRIEAEVKKTGRRFYEAEDVLLKRKIQMEIETEVAQSGQKVKGILEEQLTGNDFGKKQKQADAQRKLNAEIETSVYSDPALLEMARVSKSSTLTRAIRSKLKSKESQALLDKIEAVQNLEFVKLKVEVMGDVIGAREQIFKNMELSASEVEVAVKSVDGLDVIRKALPELREQLVKKTHNLPDADIKRIQETIKTEYQAAVKTVAELKKIHPEGHPDLVKAKQRVEAMELLATREFKNIDMDTIARNGEPHANLKDFAKFLQDEIIFRKVSEASSEYFSRVSAEHAFISNRMFELVKKSMGRQEPFGFKEFSELSFDAIAKQFEKYNTQTIIQELFGIDIKSGRLTDLQISAYEALTIAMKVGGRIRIASLTSQDFAFTRNQLLMSVGCKSNGIVALGMGGGKTIVYPTVLGSLFLSGQSPNHMAELIVSSKQEIQNAIDNPKYTKLFYDFELLSGTDLHRQGNLGKTLESVKSSSSQKTCFVFDLETRGHLCHEMKTNRSLKLLNDSGTKIIDEADAMILKQQSFINAERFSASWRIKQQAMTILDEYHNVKRRYIQERGLSVTDELYDYDQHTGRLRFTRNTKIVRDLIKKLRQETDFKGYNKGEITYLLEQVLRAKAEIDTGSTVGGNKRDPVSGINYGVKDGVNINSVASQIYEAYVKEAGGRSVNFSRTDFETRVSSLEAFDAQMSRTTVEASVQQILVSNPGVQPRILGGSGTTWGAVEISRGVATKVYGLAEASFSEYSYKTTTDRSTNQAGRAAGFVEDTLRIGKEFGGLVVQEQANLRANLIESFKKFGPSSEKIIQRIAEIADVRRISRLKTSTLTQETGFIDDVFKRSDGNGYRSLEEAITRGDVDFRYGEFVDVRTARPVKVSLMDILHSDTAITKLGIDVARSRGILKEMRRVDVFDDYTSPDVVSDIAKGTARDGKIIFSTAKAGRGMDFRGKMRLLVLDSHGLARNDLLQILGRVGRGDSRNVFYREVVVDPAKMIQKFTEHIKTLQQKVSDSKASLEKIKNAEAKKVVETEIATLEQQIKTYESYVKDVELGKTTTEIAEQMVKDHATVLGELKNQGAMMYQIGESVHASLVKTVVEDLKVKARQGGMDQKIIEDVIDRIIRGEIGRESKLIAEDRKFRSAQDVYIETMEGNVKNALQIFEILNQGALGRAGRRFASVFRGTHTAEKIRMGINEGTIQSPELRYEIQQNIRSLKQAQRTLKEWKRRNWQELRYEVQQRALNGDIKTMSEINALESPYRVGHILDTTLYIAKDLNPQSKTVGVGEYASRQVKVSSTAITGTTGQIHRLEGGIARQTAYLDKASSKNVLTQKMRGLGKKESGSIQTTRSNMQYIVISHAEHRELLENEDLRKEWDGLVTTKKWGSSLWRQQHQLRVLIADTDQDVRDGKYEVYTPQTGRYDDGVIQQLKKKKTATIQEAVNRGGVQITLGMIGLQDRYLREDAQKIFEESTRQDYFGIQKQVWEGKGNITLRISETNLEQMKKDDRDAFLEKLKEETRVRKKMGNGDVTLLLIKDEAQTMSAESGLLQSGTYTTPEARKIANQQIIRNNARTKKTQLEEVLKQEAVKREQEIIRLQQQLEKSAQKYTKEEKSTFTKVDEEVRDAQEKGGEDILTKINGVENKDIQLQILMNARMRYDEEIKKQRAILGSFDSTTEQQNMATKRMNEIIKHKLRPVIDRIDQLEVERKEEVRQRYLEGKEDRAVLEYTIQQRQRELEMIRGSKEKQISLIDEQMFQALEKTTGDISTNILSEEVAKLEIQTTLLAESLTMEDIERKERIEEKITEEATLEAVSKMFSEEGESEPTTPASTTTTTSDLALETIRLIKAKKIGNQEEIKKQEIILLLAKQKEETDELKKAELGVLIAERMKDVDREMVEAKKRLVKAKLESSSLVGANKDRIEDSCGVAVSLGQIEQVYRDVLSFAMTDVNSQLLMSTDKNIVGSFKALEGARRAFLSQGAKKVKTSKTSNLRNLRKRKQYGELGQVLRTTGETTALQLNEGLATKEKKQYKKLGEDGKEGYVGLLRDQTLDTLRSDTQIREITISRDKEAESLEAIKEAMQRLNKERERFVDTTEKSHAPILVKDSKGVLVDIWRIENGQWRSRNQELAISGRKKIEVKKSRNPHKRTERQIESILTALSQMKKSSGLDLSALGGLSGEGIESLLQGQKKAVIRLDNVADITEAVKIAQAVVAEADEVDLVFEYKGIYFGANDGKLNEGLSHWRTFEAEYRKSVSKAERIFEVKFHQPEQALKVNIDRKFFTEEMREGALELEDVELSEGEKKVDKKYLLRELLHEDGTKTELIKQTIDPVSNKIMLTLTEEGMRHYAEHQEDFIMGLRQVQGEYADLKRGIEIVVEDAGVTQESKTAREKVMKVADEFILEQTADNPKVSLKNKKGNILKTSKVEGERVQVEHIGKAVVVVPESVLGRADVFESWLRKTLTSLDVKDLGASVILGVEKLEELDPRIQEVLDKLKGEQITVVNRAGKILHKTTFEIGYNQEGQEVKLETIRLTEGVVQYLEKADFSTINKIVLSREFANQPEEVMALVRLLNRAEFNGSIVVEGASGKTIDVYERTETKIQTPVIRMERFFKRGAVVLDFATQKEFDEWLEKIEASKEKIKYELVVNLKYRNAELTKSQRARLDDLIEAQTLGSISILNRGEVVATNNTGLKTYSEMVSPNITIRTLKESKLTGIKNIANLKKDDGMNIFKRDLMVLTEQNIIPADMVLPVMGGGIILGLTRSNLAYNAYLQQVNQQQGISIRDYVREFRKMVYTLGVNFGLVRRQKIAGIDAEIQSEKIRMLDTAA